MEIKKATKLFTPAPSENTTLGSQKMAGSILWQAVMSFLRPNLTTDMRFVAIGRWGLKMVLRSTNVTEINNILQKGNLS